MNRIFSSLDSNAIEVSFIIPVKFDPRVIECTKKIKEYASSRAITAEVLVCGRLEHNMIPQDIWFIEVDPPDKGSCVRAGALASRGHIIVAIDADLPVLLTDLDKLLSAVENADVVFGNRYLPSSSIPDSGLSIRSFASRIFRILVQNLFQLKGFDTQCGVKALRQSSKEMLFNYLLIKGLAYDVELALRAKLLGFSVAQIPVHLQRSSNSTICIWHVIPTIAKEVFSLYYNFKLKRCIRWSGISEGQIQASNKDFVSPSEGLNTSHFTKP
jgi:glycosyltransferase involved in cell wall biosynthesis